MLLSQWLQEAEKRLSRAGVESARLEAQLLAAHVLVKDRAWILANSDGPIEPSFAEPLLERRIRREPLAYLLGYREFYGRRFFVDSRVLIPRQETEILVEAALSLWPAREEVAVLDLGTGSGCVGITLALERPSWKVTLSDLSPGALEVAKGNAQSLSATVEVIQSDFFASLAGRLFDAIVTNPPYVRKGADLQPEVGAWEPAAALFAGTGGLEAFEAIAERASVLLTPGGSVLTEIGDGQVLEATSVFEAAGWIRTAIWRDLDGRERVLVFRPSQGLAGPPREP